MDNRPQEHRTARPAAFAVLMLSMAGALAQAATPPTAVPAAKATATPVPTPSSDGSFTVTLTLNASLSGLHPDAAQGAWLCSARAMSKPAIDAEMSKIGTLSGSAVRAEFSSFLEYRAHYLGQQATVKVPVASGTTGAVPPISVTMKRDDLIDPATHRAIDQPTVLIGCWLQLTNTAGQGGFAVQVEKPSSATASPTSMLQVSTPPWILASASIPNE